MVRTTAAMGVRGTDFQVIYNRKNRVTNLVTFSGEVAMASWGRSQFRSKLDRSSIEGFLNDKKAVRVRRGQFSGSRPGEKRPSMPVKISPSQFDSLKKNDTGLNQSKNSGTQKRYRSEVPPGVDGQNFVSDGKGMAGKMQATMGEGQAKRVMTEIDKVAKSQLESAPPAEGMYEKSTGTYAPPAGGLIDDKTALYVPPPKGSTYDENAGVYVPPVNVGTYDRATGEYVPPAGYKLANTGDFIPVATAAGGRGPASASGGLVGGMAPPSSIQVGAPNLEMDGFTQDQMIREFQNDVHNQYNNAPPPIGAGTKTRVKIQFTVQ